MFPDHLLDKLNDEQLAAVTLPDEPALILAGAGSGKTRVLTTRIAWLIQQGRVSPSGILAVTFTNKAAKEMLARLGAMLPINLRGMWIGTFHGLCNRFLRAHHRDAGLPQTFQILDSADQLSAIKRLLKGLNVDDQKYPAKNLQHFINNCKEEGLRAEKTPAHDPQSRKFVELYEEYDRQCQREGVVDFAELLLRSYEVLLANEPLREHYQRRFRHILVDEFQDTNNLQYKWLKLLGRQASVFAVGDDDQSIYAFRGANVGNMAAFERDFRVQHLIKLEQNYRSYSNILDCANELIANNGNRLGKNLRTTRGHGEPVRIYESMTDQQEAQWLVDEAQNLIAGGKSRSEIAVLYRSNAQSRVIESALFKAGIPYRVYGGLRFFERAEIKHALAYLRLMENPHDDTAFLRVVNFPARGIGARSMEQLSDIARERQCSLHQAVPYLSGKAGKTIGDFVTMVDGLRFETAGLRLPEAVDQMLETSGLRAHYRAEKEGQERLENLDELVNAAANFISDDGMVSGIAGAKGFGLSGSEQAALAEGAGFDATGGGQGDAGFGADGLAAGGGADGLASDGGPAIADGAIALVPDADGVLDLPIPPLAAFLAHASLEAGDNQAEAGQDAMQLMTVHAAKGLEFDVVFLTGLEEGLFPHENAAAETSGLEEERRLMYVAITRARERLYISHAQTRMLHGQTRYNVRSRFLGELPEGCCKWLTPRISGYAAQQAGSVKAGWKRDWKESRSTGWEELGEYDAKAARRADIPDTGGGPVPGWVQKQQASDAGLRLGQSVRHAKFGEGVVTNIEGSGSDARAQINFRSAGSKWLALSVAKLEPL
ncbi:UvrD-helicase domain-containing protein [Derxia gummosa]|uniref:DNA 3'-5' helicase n=1 Tax=Derxia gummosa DSM 723 TaxID=1121388 RepID=A0A8B6X1A5_9BURK|nr:UvrD-helicase domain-containing protein [Derxia gummosa]